MMYQTFDHGSIGGHPPAGSGVMVESAGGDSSGWGVPGRGSSVGTEAAGRVDACPAAAVGVRPRRASVGGFGAAGDSVLGLGGVSPLEGELTSSCRLCTPSLPPSRVSIVDWALGSPVSTLLSPLGDGGRVRPGVRSCTMAEGSSDTVVLGFTGREAGVGVFSREPESPSGWVALGGLLVERTTSAYVLVMPVVLAAWMAGCSLSLTDASFPTESGCWAGPCGIWEPPSPLSPVGTAPPRGRACPERSCCFLCGWSSVRM